MKRLITLLLCLCMILPMVFAMAFGADAAEASDAPTLSTDKSVYAPGEAIKITASAGGEKDWVGIVPADAEGKPITNGGGLYWKYVNDLDDSSITTGKPMKEANAIALAERLGLASKDELFSVPTGKYFAFRVPNDMGLPAAVAADVVTYVPFTVSQFALEKTSFLYGEAINAKALYKNSTKGYIGLSHVKDDGTIGQNLYYTYITDANLNTTIDVAKGVLYGADKDKYGRLPAGRYLVYFVENGNMGAGNRDQRSEVYIDIVGATVEKTEFKYGEPIMVTGYGAGKDWIGISQYDSSTESGYYSNGSIRWRYIEPVAGKSEAENGFGSGVAFDIREAKLTAAAAARGDLPVGEHVIFVGLDDCYAKEVSAYTEIHITITADAPDAPTAVSYVLDDSRTGLAGGTLTVTFAQTSMALSKKPARVELYWGDENGNPLAGYGKIGDRKITGAVTEIELTDSMVIPEGAKKLMVRAFNGAGYATEAVAAEVPAHSYRATGARVTSFQIVSDMHIGRTNTDANGMNLSDKHATMMFEDIMELDPDSVGIFVAGDAADHGQVAEYERLFELWAAANQNGLKPSLYIGVGNHEMMANTAGHNYNSQENYSVQSDRFLTYANGSLTEAEKTTTPYYYVNRGGQHFIFLATEYCGTHAYLSDAQLNWLSAKLAEVAADGAPVFIMLHQPLYNTIAGGLASEDGSKRQGWHGVIAGDANFELWKAESGGNLSDHGKMYGQYEAPLRDILAQYPSVMMFSGHSHWIMESVGNIYEATEAQPNYMFNTASVSYLWTDNDDLHSGTGTPEGGQGYFVTVYENCIEFRGRDFVNGTWIPNAYYRVWLDCAHEYESDCTAACKWCGETREAPHAYDNACDTDCNVCGATREVGDHVYDNACDTDCNVCDAVREITHTYDNACDAACNVCGATRTVGEHVYDNACDASCNECDAAREVGDHVYDNACDTDCNVCGAVREITHTYDNACDAACNVCGATRTVGDHVYDNACDASCNECDAAREVGDHVYDNACDTACNICQATREVGEHVYDNACDASCNECGETRTVGPHIYDDETCDADCNVCGALREVPHVYDNACDAVCNVCEHIRTVGDHVYDDETCDADCNECGAIREVTHLYDNACDTVCNVCEHVRTVGDHVYDNETCDADCNECGAIREVPHVYDNACDASCNECGETRTVGPHIYDNETCDVDCNECGAIREVAHLYDNACDAVCNVCEHTREVGDHIYDDETCDADCNECGALRTVAHVRSYPCDTACRVCETEIEPERAHRGYVPCTSTVCKYGCGTVLTPVPHEGVYECSASCRYNCGTLLDRKEHAGEYPCSDVCRYCGIAVPHGDHVYGEESQPHNATQHKRVCVCGEAAVYEDHVWGVGYLTTPPTVEIDGVLTYTCEECGALRMETVEKLPETSADTGSGSSTENNAGVSGDQTDTGEEKDSGTGVVVAVVVAVVVVVGGATVCTVVARKKKKD